MKNVKYIPGDLVRSNNNPKIIWKVKDVSQDKKGNVLYRLIAVEEEEAFVYLYESQIAPIPLTAAILEANGWEKSSFCLCYFRYYKKGNKKIMVDVTCYKDGKWYVEFNQYKIFIQYYHELQHLLFGLGLNSELKV